MGADFEVAVIGAGFAGIGMATRLKQMGIERFAVFEKAGRVGGTWRDNTYPGAACDVPSHLYSFSWALPAWRRRYSTQADILSYLEGLVNAGGLSGHLRLDTPVASATWDGAAARWVLATAGGEVTARTVVSGVGQLNRPAWPDIPGRESFAGASWHSARWDHENDLRGKAVAVIGTGASAIQFVPEVAKVAVRLHVFQRSAPYVLPKRDSEYQGLEKEGYSRLIALRRADRLRIFVLGELLTAGYLNQQRAGQVLKQWRRHLDSSISDPGLKAKCIPDYQVGCKRIGFSNDWYPALSRPNVELVTEPITRITPDGVITAGGTLRSVDVIIYGTGFKSTEFLAPMTVKGAGGRELPGEWSGGAEAFLGVAVAHFPNFFMLYGPNTNLGANSIIYMLESQISYVAQAVAALRHAGSMQVRPEVQKEFVRWVQEASRRTTYSSGCHSWYTTVAGRNTNNWPDYTFRYRRRLARLDLRDYRLRPPAEGRHIAPGDSRAQPSERDTASPQRA